MNAQSVEIHKPEQQQVANYGDSLLTVIERAARDTSVDIEKFERLMAMRERLEAQAAQRAFNAAIAEAKSEIEPITRNATGHNDKRYADFSAIAKAIDPILAKNGLTYRFRSSQAERISVTCILSHVGGHFEETTLSGPPDTSGGKNAIQSIGSSLTYLQRYSLIQMLGLATSNDDDGKKADAKPDEYEGVPLAEQGQRAATYGVEYLRGWWCKQSPEDRDKFTNSGELAAWKAMAEKAGA